MKIRGTLVLTICLAVLGVTTAFAQTASAQGGKSSGPTLIKDTENPARSAVQGQCTMQWTIAGNTSCQLAEVPAGKRLVIEHISGICRVQGTDRIRNAEIQTTLAGGNSASVWNYLVLTSQSSTPDGNYSTVSQPMRAYADPGSTVLAIAWFEGLTTDSSQACTFSMSGHLVDVQ
jgi:hypothetical protein